MRCIHPFSYSRGMASSDNRNPLQELVYTYMYGTVYMDGLILLGCLARHGTWFRQGTALSLCTVLHFVFSACHGFYKFASPIRMYSHLNHSRKHTALASCIQVSPQQRCARAGTLLVLSLSQENNLLHLQMCPLFQ